MLAVRSVRAVLETPRIRVSIFRFSIYLMCECNTPILLLPYNPYYIYFTLGFQVEHVYRTSSSYTLTFKSTTITFLVDTCFYISKIVK